MSWPSISQVSWPTATASRGGLGKDEKQRWTAVFRFLDPSGEGQVSKDERLGHLRELHIGVGVAVRAYNMPMHSKLIKMIKMHVCIHPLMHNGEQNPTLPPYTT